MKSKFVTIILVVLLLAGCASSRNYEEIVAVSLDSYWSDSITFHVHSWRYIDSPDSLTLSDQEIARSAKDQELCVDENRGKRFKGEALPILYFMQCMNKKGWRLHTENVIVM